MPSALPGQRGITPAFGYGAPHSSTGGTLTLLNNALLSAHYDPLRDPAEPPSLPGTLELLPPPGLGFPHSPRSPSQHAMLITPVDPCRCICRLLPGRYSLPRYSGGSTSTTSLSRPAQASLALRPAGLLSHPRQLLSQGSDPACYQAKSLVSYQTYRLLSERDFHPLAICAVGAH
jgi:hypothetical protein